jgi:hypothetical protein
MGHPDKDVVTAAAVDGDKTAMNQIIEYQRGIADKLYGKHKGMTIILSSGGTWRHDQNNLPQNLDTGSDLPDNLQHLVNPKFVHKI